MFNKIKEYKFFIFYIFFNLTYKLFIFILFFTLIFFFFFNILKKREIQNFNFFSNYKYIII